MTQTARREDKTTNQQATDFMNSPAMQRQASRPALLLTAPPASPLAPKQWWNSRPPAQFIVEPLHPTPIRRTRDCSQKPGADAEQTWAAGSATLGRSPPSSTTMTPVVSFVLRALLARCRRMPLLPT